MQTARGSVSSSLDLIYSKNMVIFILLCNRCKPAEKYFVGGGGEGVESERMARRMVDSIK